MPTFAAASSVKMRPGVTTAMSRWHCCSRSHLETATLLLLPGCGQNVEHCSPAHATPDDLDWRHMVSPVGPNVRASEDNDDDIVELRLSDLTNPRNAPPTYSGSLSGFESLGNTSNYDPEDPYLRCSEIPVQSAAACSEDYEGLEGIYRFLQECENARR